MGKYFFIGYQIGCIYLLSIAYLYPSVINEISLICPPTPYYNGPKNLSKSYSVKKYCNLYCLWCIFCCYYKPKIADNFKNYKTYLNYCQQESMDNDSEDFKYVKKNKQFLESKWKIMYDANDNNNECDRIWNEWFVLQSKSWGFP